MVRTQGGNTSLLLTLKKEVQKYNITDAPINVLFADSKKNFWIGTNKGLFLYDYNKKEKKK